MNLAELRKIKGLSQSMLADKIKISKRTLQSYEQGLRDINKMSSDTLYLISVALGVRMEDLIDIERINEDVF